MERKAVMFTSVAAAAISVGSFVGSPVGAEPIPQAATYADLLEPVPNVMERLNAADAADQNGEAHLTLAQYGGGVAHHHHHHHHHHSRHWYRANGYVWSGGAWVRRPVHHHHHHHDHQQNY